MIEDILEDGEEFQEIRGFPDYYITSNKRIISTKQKSPRVMSTWSSNNSDMVVDLRKNNKYHRRSVIKIHKDHFGVYMTPPSVVYEYIMEYYPENEEVLGWADDVLEKEINRHKK